MKRKVIDGLLDAEDKAAAAENILAPFVAEPGHKTALLLLRLGVKRAMKTGRSTAEALYEDLCTVPADALVTGLRSMSSRLADLPREEASAAQAVLDLALTSRPGRPRVNAMSREEQVAAAQQRRAEKMASLGRKRLAVWVSSEAIDYLDAVKLANNCSSVADALQLVLNAQMKGKALQRPK